MTPGTRIVRSCELVDGVWSQVQELCNSLTAMTATTLENGDFESLRSAGAWTGDWDEAPSGWGSTGYAMRFPVAEKRRRKATVDGWINFQVSVFGGGIPPLQGGHAESVGPVIHVSFWQVQIDFRESGMFVEFPLTLDEYLQVRSERLLYWDALNDGTLPQWTFTIRLLDLNSEDALRRAIIEPIQALLKNVEPAVALPDTLPGLVFYTSAENEELGPIVVALEQPL